MEWLNALYLLDYVFMRSFTHLLTYLHSWLCAYKTGNISETVEDRAKATLTAYIKSYAAKMHDLGPLSEIQSQLEVLIIELWQFFPDPDRDPERTPESG